MGKPEYIRVENIEEAARMLSEGGVSSRVLAGGTDLIGIIRENLLPDAITKLVSLKGVPSLKGISCQNDNSIYIGSMTTLSEIAADSDIRRIFPALAEAAKGVASPQIRHVATIGGNICQAPRCWYYRYQGNKYNCIRKGGRSCSALTGRNEYHSIFGGIRVKRPPCESVCPNGTPIPEYISDIRNGNIDEAGRKLFSVNPIAAVTGRICPRACEDGCNRNEEDFAVAVRNIEKYLGDHILEHIDDYFIIPEKKSGKRVAVIGTGPAGLTAAFKLTEYGHEVTMLDKNKEAGGMLYYGIPSSRLPKSILNRIRRILENKGVKFELETEIGKDVVLSEIENGYDAVLIANGSWKALSIGCEGEETRAISGIDFLRDIAKGEKVNTGVTVAVIGGGNTAIDAARTAKGLGAGKVMIYYRRSRAEMPAEPDEISEAEKEGILIQELVSPIRINKTGETTTMVLQKMKLGDPDESGRRRPIAIKGCEESVQADTVIVAVGQTVDWSGFEILYSEKGVLDSDPETGETKTPKLYAAGDSAHGTATVIKAVYSARKAASAINTFLTGCKPEKCVAFSRNVNTGADMAMTSGSIGIEVERCMNCCCVAVSPSDIAVALLALNAVIVTNKRRVPAEEFFDAGIMTSTVLDRGEFVVSIEIPGVGGRNKQVYEKYRTRSSIDFPIVSIAVSMDMENGVVSKPGVALGAVYPVPLRMKEVENYLDGKVLDEKTILEASEMIIAKTSPLVENGHKITVVSVMFKRILERFSKGGN